MLPCNAGIFLWCHNLENQKEVYHITVIGPLVFSCTTFWKPVSRYSLGYKYLNTHQVSLLCDGRISYPNLVVRKSMKTLIAAKNTLQDSSSNKLYFNFSSLDIIRAIILACIYRNKKRLT